MRTKLFLTIIVALAMAMPLSSFSQSGSFSMHVGPGFPIGDFGDDDLDDEDSGLAGVGFDLGGKYVYQLNSSGLGLFVGADLMFNGFKSDVKDDLEDGSDGDITFPNYINVPVLAGLNYTFEANSQISLFGEFGLGADLLKFTNEVIEGDDGDLEVVFDPDMKMAYKIGGGLIFNKNIGVEFNYFNLGKHKLDGEYKYDGDTEDIDDPQKIKVGIVTLTISKRF
jgi:opacity protein-like surface antigen